MQISFLSKIDLDCFEITITKEDVRKLLDKIHDKTMDSIEKYKTEPNIVILDRDSFLQLYAYNKYFNEFGPTTLPDVYGEKSQEFYKVFGLIIFVDPDAKQERVECLYFPQTILGLH